MNAKGETSGFWVLSTLGSDQVGVVARVTGLLHREYKANIVKQFATEVGGRFSCLICFWTPRGAELERDAESLGVTIRALLDDQTAGAFLSRANDPFVHCSSNARPGNYMLKCFAFDRDGIISELTNWLWKHGEITIVGVFASQHPAPELGNPWFLAELRLKVPNPTTARRKRLEEGLGVLQRERGWRLELIPECIEPDLDDDETSVPPMPSTHQWDPDATSSRYGFN